MNNLPSQKRISRALSVVLATSLSLSSLLYAAPTQIANGPLANAASSTKPNLMFILDISGSMASRGTPDYTMNESLCRGASTPTNNSFVQCEDYYPPWYNYDFNTQYYDPRIRYEPAVNYNGTSRTSYTNPASVPRDPYGIASSANDNLETEYPDVAWCINSGDSPTDTTKCKRNGVGGAGGYQYPSGQFVNRVDTKSGPYYYNIIPTEYCRANTDPPLSQCVDATAPTTVSGISYSVPAKVRYCSDTNLTNCQDLKTPTYPYSNLARGRYASGTIVVGSGSNSTAVSSIKINGVEIISGTTSASTSRNTVASRIADAINNFASTPDYTATVNNQTVTVRPRDLGTAFNGFTISVTSSGSRTITTNALANGRNPPNMQRINIVSTTTSYTKYPNRTDCAGATCTYAEEVTNFNNWYAYYSTRINMMKTATGRAFASIDDSYRVGFITILSTSNMPSSRFLAVNDYTTSSGGQKEQWFKKLYDQSLSGSTPLREALSRVGRYFANKTDGINNGMPSGPIQVACQQNFAILSTDGYWNGNAGQTVGGNAIGNQDNALGTGSNQVPRPLYDGNVSGASDTLADVAAYYYKTDLRTDLANQVPTTAKDTADWQHMTTFTIGLGVSGLLRYEQNYEISTTGDFNKLKLGTINWPKPDPDSPTAVDDLWHAAVNGRGQYFSARNPQDVVEGLYTALSAINIRIGAGAAAATSNLQPVSGDDSAFTAEYTTVQWTGDLKARKINLDNGQLLPAVVWSAQSALESKDWTTRQIYTATTNTGTYPRKLKPFTYSDLTVAERAFFNPNLLGQYGGYTVGQRAVVTDERLINFLRGEKTYYDTGASPALDTDLFRARVKVFGDIVNAQPGYMKASPYEYADPGHSAFVDCTLGNGTGCPSGLGGGTPRAGTVYVGANDGMLHAFDTEGASAGQERWGFIPSVVMPKMYKLANTNYVHDYYVDGSPVLADICVAANCKDSGTTSASWRTVLIGGLNSGGRGYYALDVTNPSASNVKLLWEFKVRTGSACAATLAAAIGASDDCDLGLSYAPPVIGKRKSDGKWVVLVTSGYNNVNPGDGKGYLFVLDATTGVILHKLPLPSSAGGSAGTATPLVCSPATILPTYPYCNANPIGLGKVNAYIESNNADNTILQAFAGDLNGNVWRFDLSGAPSSFGEAFLIAQVTDSGGKPQPITTRIEVGKVRVGAASEPSNPAIFFGTGKYLGNDDPGNVQTQTIYGMRADLTSTISAPRSSLSGRTLGADVVGSTSTTRSLISSGSDIDWDTKLGWYVDLPVTGERVSVDPGLSVGTLVMASNVPTTSSCEAGGFGYFNTIDYQSGRQIGASTSAFSTKVSGALVVGVSTIKLPGNKLVSIITKSNNDQITLDVPVNPPGFGGKRVSWREILTD